MIYTIILQALANTIISGAITLTTLYLIRNKIYEKAQQIIIETIKEQIELTLQNPKETVQALKPLLIELLNELMKDSGKNQTNYIKMPLLGKIPLEIIQPILEKLIGNRKQHEENNPFA